MTAPIKYEIRTVADFAQVPPDRRALCLSEFLLALEFYDATKDITKDDWAFQWIDDDEGDVTVKINKLAHGEDFDIGVVYHGKATKQRDSADAD